MLAAVRPSAAGGGGPVTVSISPTSQSLYWGTKNVAVAGRNFGSESVTVTGGTATSYNWYFTGTSGGTWSIYSGQGTAACVPRVADAPDSMGAATLKCDVVINGVTYTVSAALDYIIEYVDTGGTA
jgi:hypothetical protein